MKMIITTIMKCTLAPVCECVWPENKFIGWILVVAQCIRSCELHWMLSVSCEQFCLCATSAVIFDTQYQEQQRCTRHKTGSQYPNLAEMLSKCLGRNDEQHVIVNNVCCSPLRAARCCRPHAVRDENLKRKNAFIHHSKDEMAKALISRAFKSTITRHDTTHVRVLYSVAQPYINNET